ncbi:MAG: NADH-quinone oxidoreductase subunit C [Planctomycetes bacterium]|jgi:NADH-quinone oxidoreductase subunit C|nr:NADH-quinone oxidoreductase subunit C [Planctomycetota bacterium]MCL4729349.1 NADH-quinone oxidoreductase subunit C [Planctomycetota bacterium]
MPDAPKLPPTHDTHPKAARVQKENEIDHGLLSRKLGHLIKSIERPFGQTVLKVDRQHTRTVLETLAHDPELSFSMITDITAVDNLRREDFEPARRYTVIHIVYSLRHGKRLRLETDLPEHDPRIASTAGLFKGGPWGEREVYDMFGIEFTGHPDLRRVLMPDYYEHFPLRKDYPLTGLGERDNFVRAEEVE